MNKRISVAVVALLVFGLVGTACGRKEPAAEERAAGEQPKAAAAPVDPATAATISGTVKFEGTPPKPRKIDMSQDPGCKPEPGAAVTQDVVVENGNLANTFVYVKEGLGDRSFDAPQQPATLDQENCRYEPHVLAVMTNQPVQILNSDPTTHNIHPTPKNNREWNESQAPKAEPITKSFPREEVMLPVKCNQHPWMKMYVNVVKHPFFAVTGRDGKFELKRLPPGEYTVAAVHEKFGEQTTKVSVGPKETKPAEFTFKAGAAVGGE